MHIFATRWPAALLLPLSVPYLAGTWLRNRLYDAGMLRQWRLPCRVIAVGNLTVGGTGKTPMVEFLCRTLQHQGERVCVVSRGYKRKQGGLVVVSDGQRLLVEPEACGDEPFMLASKLPGVPVIVDRDRVRGGRVAVERFGAQVIVLDDAFQHRRLHSDASVVLVDSQRGFGNGWLLPAGPLRDLPSRLRQATVLVLTRVQQAQNLAPLVAYLRAYSQARIFTARHVPVDICTGEGSVHALESLRGKRVAAFCGIAQPDSFFTMLEELGAILVHRKAYPDHHAYSARDVAALCRQGQLSAAECLVTTEKDLVRVHGQDFSLPLWCLRITMHVDHARRLLEVITPPGQTAAADSCCEKIT
ncbi:MAG: tetraacyldisaccharide 4'-kinase [Candidatus Oleimicrobiaceae bacterium]